MRKHVILSGRKLTLFMLDWRVRTGLRPLSPYNLQIPRTFQILDFATLKGSQHLPDSSITMLIRAEGRVKEFLEARSLSENSNIY
jgi:hypothetical protein